MDRRDYASEMKWWKTLDRSKMTATLDYYDPDDDDVEILDATVEVRFEVCPTCDGRGSHVNPSIDAHGLTAEDFYEDPDFRDEYFGGAYDQPCNECGGASTVPIPRDETIWKAIQDKWADDAQYRAEVEAERRMGA